MGKISACVIALNEEKSLERCLKSLSFADEIVVVDGGSQDATPEIAKRYTQKVISHPFQGFTQQRNVGITQCSGDWIFFLDSDEAASEELAQKLRSVANADMSAHPNCYAICRIEYFLGKKLQYGPGNPSSQWRFFKRQGVKFQGEVHEYPVFEGPIGLIPEPIYHNPDLGIERFLNKLNSYTTLEALERFGQGQTTTLFHAFGTFFATFFKNGVRYRGFWNGKVGFVLTVLESTSRVIRHLKLWVFWQVYKGNVQMNLGMKLPEPGSIKIPDPIDLDKPRHTTNPV
jgi:glycosyltransferase involved in cell wall biosynthesis